MLSRRAALKGVLATTTGAVTGERPDLIILGGDYVTAADRAYMEPVAEMLAELGVLSGHTHGGQIVLPGIGAVAARKFPVAAGLGSRGNTSIFVSRGVGTVYVPVRINCPPEVAIVTLRAMPTA